MSLASLIKIYVTVNLNVAFHYSDIIGLFVVNIFCFTMSAIMYLYYEINSCDKITMCLERCQENVYLV